jgi:hypothetical protein
MQSMRSIAGVTLVGMGMAVALIGVGASAAPTQFSLTFDGAHFTDASFPDGIQHDGRFTASAPFCSAGRAYDVEHVVTESGFLDVMRRHVCDDGSGSMTAFMPVARNEHGGKGTWKIVEGTGKYATLRGFGTYIGTRISGDPLDFPSIVYRTAWSGVVDFDADPPAVESIAASARKLQKPTRTYSLRIAVRARDVSTPIAYTVDVRSGTTPLGFKKVSTASGLATMTLRIRPPRSAHSVRVQLAATDAVGNTANASRLVRLR